MWNWQGWWSVWRPGFRTRRYCRSKRQENGWRCWFRRWCLRTARRVLRPYGGRTLNDFGVEERGFRSHALLLELSRAEIIRLGARLGIDYAEAVSCYRADGGGRACGRCESCRLRREGFAVAGMADPTRYQADAGWIRCRPSGSNAL